MRVDTQRWQRLSQLFDAVIELPAAQREGYIRTHCADDPELVDAVQRMLGADARAESDGFLEPRFAAPEAAQRQDDAETKASSRFGPYRLLRPIGAGGMGEVHLAERADGVFEQQVALKLLPHPTPGLMQRFRQERQILARLQHPHIARLFDGGVDERGIPYFVMEYVDGQPIAMYVRERELDVGQTLRLFLHVCDAVHYAHRNLIVHRDLKPSNILIGADGLPKLLDFGIAKVLQASATDDATRTAARAFTPDYAAPEQIRGETVTTATDVYALGVVLYELLAGRRPRRRAADIDGDIEPPSAALAAGRTAAQRRRRLRGDLDRIVLTALAPQPERRYPSVEAFAADLRRWLAGRPVSARGDGALYTLVKFTRRNRLAVAAATLTAMALILATAFSLRQAQQARAEAASARASQQFMLNVFTQAEPWQNSGRQPTALELAKASMDKIDTELADQPLARADMYMGLNRLFSVADDIHLSVSAGRHAVASLQQMPAPDPARLQRAQASLAYSLYYSGDYAGADALIAALEARSDTSSLTHYSLLALQRSLARDRGQREEALRLARAVLAAPAARERGDPRERIKNLWHVADALDKIGDYRAATAAYLEYETRTVGLYAASAPARNSDIVWMLHVGAELDAPRATLDAFTRALIRQRRIFGASDYTWQALWLAARAARLAARSDVALAYLGEAHVLMANLQTDPLTLADYEAELGLTLLDRAEPAAREHLEAAAVHYREIGGEHDPRLLALRAAQAHLRVHEDAESASIELRAIHAEQRMRGLREQPETALWLAQALDATHAEEAQSVLREGMLALATQGRPLDATAFELHRELARLLAQAGAAPAADEELVATLAQAIVLYGETDPITIGLSSRSTTPATLLLVAARERAAILDRPGLHLVELAARALEAAESGDARTMSSR